MFPEDKGEPKNMSQTEVTESLDLTTGSDETESLSQRLASRRTPSHQRVRTPWWRRLTALISLGSLVIIAGITLAAVAGVSALLLLMILERAAG